MKLIVLFDIGDKIEIAEDWRLWKKGDKATVEHITTDTVDGQILTLIADENKEAEKDFNTLLASRCRSVETAFYPKDNRLRNYDYKGFAKLIDYRILVQELLITRTSVFLDLDVQFKVKENIALDLCFSPDGLGL